MHEPFDRGPGQHGQAPRAAGQRHRRRHPHCRCGHQRRPPGRDLCPGPGGRRLPRYPRRGGGLCPRRRAGLHRAALARGGHRPAAGRRAAGVHRVESRRRRLRRKHRQGSRQRAAAVPLLHHAVQARDAVHQGAGAAVRQAGALYLPHRAVPARLAPVGELQKFLRRQCAHRRRAGDLGHRPALVAGRLWPGGKPDRAGGQHQRFGPALPRLRHTAAAPCFRRAGRAGRRRRQPQSRAQF